MQPSNPLSDFLIQLAAGLTQKLIEASARRVQKAFAGDERQQALQAAIGEGLVRAIKSFSLSKDESDHMHTIFSEYFQHAEVVEELAQLLDPRPEAQLNLDLLVGEFRSAGYDPESLPGFDFQEFMTLFVRAFSDVAHRVGPGI